MFEQVSLEQQVQDERQRRLAVQAEKEELEEEMLEVLVDLDFRQSMSELGL